MSTTPIYKTEEILRVQKGDDDTETNLQISNMNFLTCGSFSSVYSGTTITDTNRTKNIVIKKLWPFKKSTKRWKELEILKKLSKSKHKNVITLFYHYMRTNEDNICMGLVFEAMPTNLYLFLKSQSRNIDIIEVKLITWQLFRGQAHIQRMDICHRDITPRNLLYNPESGLLKICDFGSSNMQSIETPQGSYIVIRYYRPPELILGSRYYGCAIDVWSCGCILGELLKGRVFLVGTSSSKQAEVIFNALGLPSNEERKAMRVEKQRCEKIISEFERDETYSTALFTYMYDPSVRREERCESLVNNDKISVDDMKEAIVLLRRILVYDPKQRMNGLELLNQKFFSDLFTGTARRFDGRTISCLSWQDLKKVKNGENMPMDECQEESSSDTIITLMAQSVPPGDIQTQPGTKIVFNASYDDKHICHIKLINSSARRIGYRIKTTNTMRLGVDPPYGVLDPKEAVLLAVSCGAFAFGREDINNDRITVEWTNTSDGAAKQFHREWFQGDGMFRRKNLPIEYNP